MDIDGMVPAVDIDEMVVAADIDEVAGGAMESGHSFCFSCSLNEVLESKNE